MERSRWLRAVKSTNATFTRLPGVAAQTHSRWQQLPAGLRVRSARSHLPHPLLKTPVFDFAFTDQIAMVQLRSSSALGYPHGVNQSRRYLNASAEPSMDCLICDG